MQENEYEFSWPQFGEEMVKINIFYLFPKEYEYEIKNSNVYEDFQDILVSGLEMYQDQ